STPTMTSSARSSVRCGRGRRSAPAGSARLGPPSVSARPNPSRDPANPPAGQAWSDDGSLRRWLDRPHELLLAELGRASRIYPELAAGLRQATPCALDLDADSAH